MEPATTSQIEATHEFAGPWWLAVALLDLQSNDLVEPVLRELASPEIGPVHRTAAHASLTLHWHTGPATDTPTTGELRIAELDANRTELTLTATYTNPPQHHTVNEIAERLARRIETALAREIGTQ